MILWLKRVRLDLAIILFLLGISLIGLSDLIKTPFYTSHDGFTHTARIAAYFQALFVDGQILPQWASAFNNAAGSPIFVYIYPIPYILGSLLHFVGFDFQTCFRIVMGLGSLLGIIFSYVWFRGHFSRPAAMFGTVLYFFVPYRFLNTYVRGAFAENLAYGFIPLSFFLVDAVTKTRKKLYFLMLIGSIALILLSHNEVSAIFLPILALYSLFKCLKFKALTPLIYLILAIITAFLASAFIYIPDLFERHFIHFDRGISYYQDHFVSLWQLFRSPWGYGFDFPGVLNDAMSFQIGLGHLLVIALAGGLFIYWCLKYKRSNFWLKNVESLTFLVAIIFSVVLMLDTPIAIFVWEKLPIVKNILDFPWRLLGVIMLGSAFLGAFLVEHLPYKKLALIGGVFIIIWLNRNHWRINQSQSFTDKDFESFHGSGTATSNEFSPARHATAKIIEANETITPLKFVGNYEILQNNSLGVRARLDSPTGGTVRINRFYFPDTKIYRNGIELVENKDWSSVGYEPDKIDEWHDDSGFLKVSLLPGKTELVVKFEKTPLRNIAVKISLGTITLLLIAFTVVLFSPLLKKRRKLGNIAGKL